MVRYICSDLQGEYDLYKQICEFIKPEDIVYNLGDSGDRGPESYRTLKEALFNPQFINLLGNHEDMLAEVYYEKRHEDESPNGFQDAFYLFCSNGGRRTWHDMENDPECVDVYMAIKQLPTHLEITNTKGQLILLSHAGYTPELDDVGNLIFPTKKQLIWDRNHINDDWNMEMRNAYVVHGHTPINIKTVGGNVLEYCRGHKFDIDNQSFLTKQCVLLNLDDLKAGPKVFHVRNS